MATTQITGRQVAPATIQQSNLGLSAAVNPNDAVIYSQLLALLAGKAIKAACRAVVLATDITFASYAGGVLTTTANFANADGIALVAGDRVLVPYLAGANAKYNGIYNYTTTAGTSQLTRAVDANTSGTGNSSDLAIGAQVNVFDGATLKRTQWLLGVPAAGQESITLNTDPINLYDVTPVVPYIYTPVFNEAPVGTQNGANLNFTLAHTPGAGLYGVTVNGIELKPGAANDYTVATNTITFAVAPVATDIILAQYMY